jgi:hypothetical protein
VFKLLESSFFLAAFTLLGELLVQVLLDALCFPSIDSDLVDLHPVFIVEEQRRRRALHIFQLEVLKFGTILLVELGHRRVVRQTSAAHLQHCLGVKDLAIVATGVLRAALLAQADQCCERERQREPSEQVGTLLLAVSRTVVADIFG